VLDVVREEDRGHATLTDFSFEAIAVSEARRELVHAVPRRRDMERFRDLAAARR